MSARSPVAGFSAYTRTPTSSEHRPTYSTWARSTATSPTLTGCRKSMSSIAPSTTLPRATREAAIVPQVAIHCIMRPPWICPGAPACSGNTQFTISVAVSEIESMVSAECRVSLAFFYHGGPSKSRRGPPRRR